MLLDHFLIHFYTALITIFFTKIDTQKTIFEHTAIILTYQKTGLLDKENAINKYTD